MKFYAYRLIAPYYKSLSKVRLGLKLMLSLLYAKRMTGTVLNQDFRPNFRPRFVIRGIKFFNIYLSC
jgi:hypothetical protein